MKPGGPQSEAERDYVTTVDRSIRTNPGSTAERGLFELNLTEPRPTRQRTKQLGDWVFS